jgi:hypothetical protein
LAREEIYHRLETFLPWGSPLSAPGHYAADGFLGFGDIHMGLIRALNPARCLCIGSARGFIPAIMGMAIRNYGGHLDFVDANMSEHETPGMAYGGHGHWTEKYQLQFLKHFDLHKTLSFFIERTDSFFPRTTQRYDYVYIDGDHSYAGVRYDYEQSRRCLNENGLILLHDAVVKDNPRWDFGVWRLMDELTANRVIVTAWPGLAIVQP